MPSTERATLLQHLRGALVELLEIEADDQTRPFETYPGERRARNDAIAAARAQIAELERELVDAG